MFVINGFGFVLFFVVEEILDCLTIDSMATILCFFFGWFPIYYRLPFSTHHNHLASIERKTTTFGAQKIIRLRIQIHAECVNIKCRPIPNHVYDIQITLSPTKCGPSLRLWGWVFCRFHLSNFSFGVKQKLRNLRQWFLMTLSVCAYALYFRINKTTNSLNELQHDDVNWNDQIVKRIRLYRWRLRHGRCR